jgi:hypothetical protein
VAIIILAREARGGKVVFSQKCLCIVSFSGKTKMWQVTLWKKKEKDIVQQWSAEKSRKKIHYYLKKLYFK